MRRFVVAALAAGLVIGMVGTALAAPKGAPFKGKWEAVDVDGSNLDLKISPKLKMTMKDDGTTACGLVDGVPFYKSVAKGKATRLSATEIEVTLTLRCLGGGALADGSRTGEFGPFTFTYEAATDTLVPGSPLLFPVFTRR